MTGWHSQDSELEQYAAGALAPPRLWSVETHLAACPDCRAALTARLAHTTPALVDDGWARLDAELDAPRPGGVERMLLWAGLSDHTARLLAATPVLRRSWLLAMAVTLLFAVTAGHLSGTDPGLPLLVLAPLLPIVGVAASFGPRVDPTHEIALVAPLHGFRLLLLRTGAVLTATSALSLLGGLALSEFSLRPLGWLVPALTLTVLSLVLVPRLGPVGAPTVVGLGWLSVVVLATQTSAGTPAPFTATGQALGAALGAAGFAALLAFRNNYDAAWPPHHPTPRGNS